MAQKQPLSRDLFDHKFPLLSILIILYILATCSILIEKLVTLQDYLIACPASRPVVSLRIMAINSDPLEFEHISQWCFLLKADTFHHIPTSCWLEKSVL